MMNDRVTGSRMLRQLREKRGWSWADQARALHALAGRLGISAVTSAQLTSLQRTIARWESIASGIAPSERYQLLLAQLYVRDQFGELALDEGFDLDALLAAFEHVGVPMERTRELRDLMIRSAYMDDSELIRPAAGGICRLPSETARDQLDGAMIERIGSSLSEVDRQIGQLPFIHLQLLLAPVVEKCLQLGETSPLEEQIDPVRCKAFLLRGAVTLLHDCVDVAAATGGRVVTQRVSSVRRALTPWRTESFVAELEDHIYDSLLAK